MRISAADLAALTRRAVEDGGFKTFVKLAWSLVCPEPLEWNWHIEEFCDAVEGIAKDRKNGLSRKLAVCVPPASTKSKIISVLFQPWVWTWWPESAWITCTYEQDLATDLSVESRTLIQSDWYQAAWPLKLVKDAGRHWINERGGWRRAVGTGGPITGKHAHFHIGDDLVKEQDTRIGTPMAIAKVVEKANGFWFGTMVTRKLQQAIARIIVGQMLHVDDTPNTAIRKYDWDHIVFPMRFELDHPHRSDRDHRTEEGELLHEARCDENGVKELERELGPSGALAQLQQRPIPPGGQILIAAYLSNRYENLPGKLKAYLEGMIIPPGLKACIYGDLAFKGKPTSSFVSLQFWIAYMFEYYLIDQARGQWGFRESKQQVKDLKNRYPMVRAVKLEDAANAPAMEDDLKRKVDGIQLAPVAGGCLARTQQVEDIWAAGQVWLPANAPWMGGSDGFVAEHLAFDGLKTRPDDQVATSSLALLDLSSGTAKAYAERWKKVKF